MKKITTTIFSLFLIALFGCSEVTGELKYMNDLKKSISEKYETKKVEINIKNNNELIVSLIDPKFDDYSSEDKQQISREIGSLAQELREEGEEITKGMVMFRKDRNYGIAKTSSMESFYMYD